MINNAQTVLNDLTNRGHAFNIDTDAADVIKNGYRKVDNPKNISPAVVEKQVKLMKRILTINDNNNLLENTKRPIPIPPETYEKVISSNAFYHNSLNDYSLDECWKKDAHNDIKTKRLRELRLVWLMGYKRPLNWKTKEGYTLGEYFMVYPVQSTDVLALFTDLTSADEIIKNGDFVHLYQKFPAMLPVDKTRAQKIITRIAATVRSMCKNKMVCSTYTNKDDHKAVEEVAKLLFEALNTDKEIRDAIIALKLMDVNEHNPDVVKNIVFNAVDLKVPTEWHPGDVSKQAINKKLRAEQAENYKKALQIIDRINNQLEVHRANGMFEVSTTEPSYYSIPVPFDDMYAAVQAENKYKVTPPNLTSATTFFYVGPWCKVVDTKAEETTLWEKKITGTDMKTYIWQSDIINPAPPGGSSSATDKYKHKHITELRKTAKMYGFMFPPDDAGLYELIDAVDFPAQAPAPVAADTAEMFQFTETQEETAQLYGLIDVSNEDTRNGLEANMLNMIDNFLQI
jgi:hypothetical protein